MACNDEGVKPVPALVGTTGTKVIVLTREQHHEKPPFPSLSRGLFKD